MKNKQKIYQITHDVEFQNKHLSLLAERQHVNSYTIMRVIGHSGSETAMRYRNGETEPKPSQLANICSQLNFNLLEFFTYNGVQLKSDIDDIYRLEQLGVTAGDILREYGLKPIDRINDAALTKDDAKRYIISKDEELNNAKGKDRNNIGFIRDEIERLGQIIRKDRVTPDVEQYEQRIEQLLNISHDQQETIKYLRDQLRQKEAQASSTPYRIVADETEPSK